MSELENDIDETKSIRRPNEDNLEDLQNPEKPQKPEIPEASSNNLFPGVFPFFQPNLLLPQQHNMFSPLLGFSSAYFASPLPSPLYNNFNMLSFQSPRFFSPQMPFPQLPVSQPFLPVFPPFNVPNFKLATVPTSSSRNPVESPAISEQESVDSSNKENRVKKPPNAYLIFMSMKRKTLPKENLGKPSAEVNKELGVIWNQMTEEEKKPYFELAKVEKDKHAKDHPNWSARDNYGINKKRRKSKEEESPGEGNGGRKCRARFGVENQDSWCLQCRRKKRCIYANDPRMNVNPY